MGASNNSMSVEGTGAMRHVRQPRATLHAATCLQGSEWSGRDSGLQYPILVHNIRPQGFSRRQFNLGKYDGRLDARGMSRVLDDTLRSLYHTVLFRAVGVGEFLLDAMLFAPLQTHHRKTPPRCTPSAHASAKKFLLRLLNPIYAHAWRE